MNRLVRMISMGVAGAVMSIVPAGANEPAMDSVTGVATALGATVRLAAHGDFDEGQGTINYRDRQSGQQIYDVVCVAAADNIARVMGVNRDQSSNWDVIEIDVTDGGRGGNGDLIDIYHFPPIPLEEFCPYPNPGNTPARGNITVEDN